MTEYRGVFLFAFRFLYIALVFELLFVDTLYFLQDFIVWLLMHEGGSE